MKADMEKSMATLETCLDAEGAFTLSLGGRLDASSAGPLWKKMEKLFAQGARDLVRIDVGDLVYIDGAGAALLVEISRRQLQAGRRYELVNLNDEFRQLLDLFDPADYVDAYPSKPACSNLPSEVGRASVSLWRNLITLIAFVGELSAALVHALLHFRKIRWKDTFLIFEATGINALPIIALLSFLVGLIMAFQSAIPMQQFGVEIYVANLIALSMLRELGPLMTAIILAGRSGSSFAAELGTMKVNEEVDALTTLGLDPVRFLAIPRLLAALVATPLLTIFSGLCGLLGGAVVLLAMGYPLVTYANQVISAVSLQDLVSGLAKTFVFGLLIAGIGCLHGLQAERGASGVGKAATRAVVAGIILIIVTDGIFAVVYYYLGF
ncbi:MlaE family lipid ABC transporter permease subunit [Desulfuromonas sp. AOP6]|uniref:ABC transporter permease n=1 Tax=Desulfuromonas sp. AOP6 TaxID=1566351 RepID=UPI00127AAC33|nr:MlaE family lipid ABC transporter permease subunit [Desulfuromonas sp. AOP6]BCA80761.1 glycoprotein endopeptidase metalloprotease [Desulfuromonas sp. AOP6]